jgi:hypothetical protein
MYAFDSPPASEYALYFEATTGGGSVFVRDSISSAQLAFVSDVAGGLGLDAQVSTNFSRAGTLLLEVFGVTPDTTNYRFYIYRVNRSPESRSARFTIGDTVSGESIDAVPDVDDFVAAGRAGQYVGGWIEPLGPPTANTFVNMDVADSAASGVFINRTGNGIGQTPRSLFVAGPHRSNQDYRFTVPAPRLSNLQYTGPYRFYAYEIDPAPESASGSLPVNSVVNEAIDIGGDIDDFTFPATAGSEFNLFVQSSAARPVGASVISAIEGGASVGSVAVDTGMFDHATGRFKVLSDTTLRVRVRGQLVSDAVGPYRLYLYRINRAPESVARAVTIGDTVAGESIDLPGDVDEYTFSGNAGDQFNVFLAAANPVPPLGVAATVLDPAGRFLTIVRNATPDTPLLSSATGSFSLPTTGEYRISVEGSVGPYRLLLYRLNPLPESTSAAISLGDSLTGERIDAPGDYDQFTFSVTAPTYANFVLWRDSAVTEGGLGLSVRGPGDAGVCSTPTIDPGTGDTEGAGCGTVLLGAGDYTITIQSFSSQSHGYHGPYRLNTYAINLLPELAAESLAIGDTVSGDLIDPPGDIDTYYFHGEPDQHIDVWFQPTGAPYEAYLGLGVLDSAGHGIGGTFGKIGTASLDEYHTNRIDLPASGRYQVRVSSENGGRLLGEQGPYRFTVKTVSTATETSNPNIVVGDSVGAESIDFSGDIDRFTLTGLPGQELQAVFQSMPGPGPLVLAVLDTVSRDTVITQLSTGFVQASARFILPANGVVWIRVLQPRICDPYYGCGSNPLWAVGPYWFKIVTP